MRKPPLLLLPYLTPIGYINKLDKESKNGDKRQDLIRDWKTSL